MFTIGSLFHETWELFKAKYALFMASIAIVGGIQIAFEILTYVVPFWQTSEGIFGLGDVLALFISPVLHVGLGFVALQAYRKNEIQASGVFAGFSQYSRMLGISFLVGLLGIVSLALVFIAAGVTAFAIGGDDFSQVFGATLVLLPGLVAAIIVLTRLGFAVFVCFDTKCSVIESFGESWRRTKLVYWKILGSQLLLGLMGIVCTLLLVLPLFFFFAPFAVSYLGVLLGKLLDGHNEQAGASNNPEPSENPAFPGPLNG